MSPKTDLPIPIKNIKGIGEMKRNGKHDQVITCAMCLICPYANNITHKSRVAEYCYWSVQLLFIVVEVKPSSFNRYTQILTWALLNNIK